LGHLNLKNAGSKAGLFSVALMTVQNYVICMYLLVCFTNG
jgi:hypothetical protein